MTDVAASVVVAVHNDVRARTTVTALKQQTIGFRALQIIVVENGSDELREYLDDPHVTYLHLDQANSAAARNAGLACAKGRYLLLTDADCVPADDWAQRLLEALDQQRAAVAGGVIVKHQPRTWVQKNAITIVNGQATASYLPASPYPYVAGANAAFDIAALRNAGGFDPELKSGADVDACWKVQRRGGRLVTTDTALVSHEDRATLTQHMRRFRTYARYQVLLFAKHKQHCARRVVLDVYPVRRAAGAAAALPGAAWALLTDRTADPAQTAVLQLLEAAAVFAGAVEGAIAYRQPYL